MAESRHPRADVGPTKRARARLWSRLQLATLLLAVSALTTFYAHVTPPAEGPDAGAHLRYAAWLQEGWRRPELTEANARLSHQIVSQPPLYYVLVAALLGDLRAESGFRLDNLNPQWPGDSRRVSVTPPDATPREALPWRLAAFVSLWGSLLTVLSTWGLVLSALPGRRRLALAAAAGVGFNPQFLFAGATVTNDTWAAGLAVLSAWLAARACRPGPARGGAWLRPSVRAVERGRAPVRGGAWLAAGLALGAACLAKYSGFVAAVPVALVALTALPRRGLRHSAAAGAWVGLGAMAIAGWWYAGNLLQIGELVPSRRLAEILPDLSRDTPAPWSWAVGRLPWLYRSFWGVYGHGVVPGTLYQRLTDVASAAAAAGLVVLLGRAARRREARREARLALVAAGWIAATVLALVVFSRTARYGIHGRLVLPAAGGVGVLLALGWHSIAPRPWRRRLLAAVPPACLLVAAWQGAFLRSAYGLPPPLTVEPTTDRPLHARFAGGVEVLGADLPAGTAATAGGEFPVRLTLGATQPVTGFARLFVHLSDARDATYGRWDGAPAGGRHVTAQWRPGEAFQDTVLLPVPTVETSRVVTLSLGFYDPDSGARWPLLDDEGRRAGDRALAGHVWLSAAPPTPSIGGRDGRPAMHTWANGIELRSATLELDAAGRPKRLRAVWAAERPLHVDLTVFAQVLDPAGRLVSQTDRRPRGGAWPTDAWPLKMDVADEYDLPSFSGPWARVILGFYGADGARARLAGGSADHAVLVEAAGPG